MYALANDENGVPLEVPAIAVGWLVRRHGGGKGRPGAVYDGDGRPLVVDLGATARDLSAAGCTPGPYRLEAVDAGRRPLGVVAFTELGDGMESAERRGVPQAAADVSVAAMARTMEAMQRVQAEREQQMAEVLLRCIERIAPAPPQPGQDVRNAVSTVVELQKALDRIEAAKAKTAIVQVEPAQAVVTERDGESGSVLETMAMRLFDRVLESGMPSFQEWIWRKLGLSNDQITGLKTSMAAKEKASAPQADAKAAKASGGGRGRLDAVLARLTEEERSVVTKLIADMPAPVLADAETRLQGMTEDDAVVWLRTFVLAKPADPSAGASS